MLNRVCLSRIWFIGLVSVLLAYTLLRGIRFPNLWSYTHYLFNYEHGFVRRGLLGEILRILDIDYLYSYECFIFWAALILAAIAVTLACLLIHEAYLVIFLPVVVVSLVMDLEHARHALRIASVAVFLLASLIMTYSMSSLILSESQRASVLGDAANQA